MKEKYFHIVFFLEFQTSKSQDYYYINLQFFVSCNYENLINTLLEISFHKFPNLENKKLSVLRTYKDEPHSEFFYC
jgi:hypothetical protein